MKLSRSYILGMAIVAALTGYPLIAALTQAVGVNSTPFSFAYRAFLALIFAASMFFPRKFYLSRPTDTAAIFLMAFFLFYIFRLTVSTLISGEPLSRPVEFYWMWGIGGCILPSLAILVQRVSPDFSRFFTPAFMIILVSSVLALVFGSTSRVNEMGNVYSSGRFQLVALNPISLANLGATLCGLSVWRIWVSPFPVSVSWRIVSLVAFPLGLYLTLLTGSRGPLVSLAFCLVVVISYLSLTQKFKFLIAFGAFGATAVAYMLANAEKLGVGTVARILFIGSEEDLSAQGRMVSVKSALLDALDHPFLGAQLEERITGWYPHNLFAEALMATGVFAGSLFIIATLLILRMAFFSIRDRRDYSWISLIFVHHFSQAMFSSGLYIAIEFWVSACTVYLAYSVRRASRGERINSPGLPRAKRQGVRHTPRISHSAQGGSHFGPGR